jgi:peptidoglycan-N-acetylglucosamine deacetylase
MSPRLNFQASSWSPRQIARRVLANTLPTSRFLVACPKSSNQVFLTFDDGPHPIHTPRLLQVLRDFDVKATFFVLGVQVHKHPGIVQEIVADGHSIGHHTFHHGDPSTVSADVLMRELGDTERLLKALMNNRTKMFRPPHGKLSAGKLWRLLRGGYQTVLWNLDPKDYRCQSEAELEEWFRKNPVAGGDIVLLHDVHPYAAEVLPSVINDARRRGLEFASLG